MTNAEKFIEVMNQTFNAGLTMEKLGDIEDLCQPHMKYNKYACTGNCEKCDWWWDKEYVEPKGALNNDTE